MPWLWAITSEYSEDISIQVSVLETAILGGPRNNPDEVWWVRIKRENGEYVAQLQPHYEISLVRQIIGLLNEREKGIGWVVDAKTIITHLIKQEADGRILVLRPVKNVTIKEVCIDRMKFNQAV